jgi:ribosome-binding protein aMBF1 (putative translation factor)/quercetin dioxygenase-like cupin family protein
VYSDTAPRGPVGHPAAADTTRIGVEVRRVATRRANRSTAIEKEAGRARRPDYPQIGDQLRIRRRELGLSLRDLAERLGVSPSLISQIERGRANPSVSTLYAIVGELDISLDELLFSERRPGDGADDGQPGERTAGPAGAGTIPVIGDPSAGAGGDRGGAQLVQRAATRKHIRLASGVIWERLTTLSEPGVEFLYVIYEVSGASSPEDAFQRHAGHEWGYVISGELHVTIGFDEYLLEPGDAISIDSRIPHRLANLGDTPVHAIWFVIGRVPSEGGAIDDPGYTPRTDRRT